MNTTTTTPVATLDDVQRIVHAAIGIYGANLAESFIPEGANVADFDVLDATATLVRACRATDLTGSPGEPIMEQPVAEPGYFEGLKLEEPRTFDALRFVVRNFMEWCELHIEGAEADGDVPDVRFAYWRDEAEAARRVLAVIDGEAS